MAVTQVTAVPARPSARPARPNPVYNNVIQAQAPKCARKDRGPNWLPQEVTALVNAKRDMFLEEIDTVDGCDLMTPESTKWQRVSAEVMRCGFTPCEREFSKICLD